MCPALPILPSPRPTRLVFLDRSAVSHASVCILILPARAGCALISGSSWKRMLQPRPVSFTCKYLFDPTHLLEHLHRLVKPLPQAFALTSKPPDLLPPGPPLPKAARRPSSLFADRQSFSVFFLSISLCCCFCWG